MVNLGLRETLPRQGGGRYFARLCHRYPKSDGVLGMTPFKASFRDDA
jgi:hypothetical protein